MNTQRARNFISAALSAAFLLSLAVCSEELRSFTFEYQPETSFYILKTKYSADDASECADFYETAYRISMTQH